MNANDVNQVVDKLAEKVGLAADKVQPIAEEVVRQYTVRALYDSVCWMVFAVVFFSFAGICWYKYKVEFKKPLSEKQSGNNEDEVGWMAGVIIGAGAGVWCLIFGLIAFGNYLAPLCGIFKL